MNWKATAIILPTIVPGARQRASSSAPRTGSGCSMAPMMGAVPQARRSATEGTRLSEVEGEANGFGRHMRQRRLKTIGGADPPDRRNIILEPGIGAQTRGPMGECARGVRSLAGQHEAAGIRIDFEASMAQWQIEYPDQIGATE